MPIPTSKEWQTIRDRAGGKGAMVKGVSVTKLLDAYHKAAKGGAAAPIPDLAPRLTALRLGLEKYGTALPPNQAKVKAVVASILKDVKERKDEIVKNVGKGLGGGPLIDIQRKHAEELFKTAGWK